MTKRNHQVRRIYTILLYLQDLTYGTTLNELREYLSELKFEVDDRTLRRDLEALTDIGFTVIKDQNSGRFKIDRSIEIKKYFTLSPQDLLALSLCRSILKPLEQTPFYQDVQNFFFKIDRFIGENNREYLAELEADIVMEPWPKWGLGTSSDILDTVRHGCLEGMNLLIRYDSSASTNKDERMVGPHFICLSRGSLYLIAYDFASGKNKTFQFNSIKEAKMTDEPFTGESVTAEEYFKNSIGIYRAENPEAIKIHVSQDLAPYVSGRSFHKSQSVVKREDGSVQVHWEVGMTPELVQLILSWGRHAEVLAPESLREKVRKEAESIVRTYQKS